MEKHIVKRKGHKEPYEERKVYASAYAASLNCHHDEPRAEEIASAVVDHMRKWVHGREEIKSHEIRKEVYKKLGEMDEAVAFMYDSIMDIC